MLYRAQNCRNDAGNSFGIRMGGLKLDSKSRSYEVTDVGVESKEAV